MLDPKFQSQRRDVEQLMRDRKNGVGGYAMGFTDSPGSPGAMKGNWPMSPEQIRLAFGKPVDEEDPESDYELGLRAISHGILEEKMLDLKKYAYSLWQAVNEVYPRDDAGDRDYDWFVKKANASDREAVLATHWQLEEAKEEAQQRARLMGQVRAKDKRLLEELTAKLKRLHETYEMAEYYRGLLLRCSLGIDQLTKWLLDVDLFVQYTKRLTVREEERLERQDARIAQRYHNLTMSGLSAKAAYELLEREEGLTRRYMEKIVATKHLETTGQKRRPGRPRKSA